MTYQRTRVDDVIGCGGFLMRDPSLIASSRHTRHKLPEVSVKFKTYLRHLFLFIFNFLTMVGEGDVSGK